jgi:hypothetical protein
LKLEKPIKQYAQEKKVIKPRGSEINEKRRNKKNEKENVRLCPRKSKGCGKKNVIVL